MIHTSSLFHAVILFEAILTRSFSKSLNKRSEKVGKREMMKATSKRIIMLKALLFLSSSSTRSTVARAASFRSRSSPSSTFVTSSSSIKSRSYSLFFLKKRCQPIITTPNVKTRLFSSTNNKDNVISSPKSATVKKIHALLTKRKKRLKLNQAVVEGPRMVFDLLNNPTTENLVKQIIVSTDASSYSEELLFASGTTTNDNNLDNNKLVQYILPEIFRNVCSDTVSTQGIIAIVDIPTSDDAMSSQSKSEYPLHLILDGVSDPGNVGTLLRSSLAVEATSVVLLPGCCDVWNPKAVRSAMGASFQIPILQAASFENVQEILGGNSQHQPVHRYFAATMLDDDDDGNENSSDIRSVPHFDIDWLQEPTAIIIGSEGNGLSWDIRNQLMDNDNKSINAAHVPMTGNIESLNAAVCGSVFLFEYQRQCEMANRQK